MEAYVCIWKSRLDEAEGKLEPAQLDKVRFAYYATQYDLEAMELSLQHLTKHKILYLCLYIGRINLSHNL